MVYPYPGAQAEKETKKPRRRGKPAAEATMNKDSKNKTPAQQGNSKAIDNKASYDKLTKSGEGTNLTFRLLLLLQVLIFEILLKKANILDNLRITRGNPLELVPLPITEKSIGSCDGNPSTDPIPETSGIQQGHNATSTNTPLVITDNSAGNPSSAVPPETSPQPATMDTMDSTDVGTSFFRDALPDVGDPYWDKPYTTEAMEK